MTDDSDRTSTVPSWLATAGGVAWRFVAIVIAVGILTTVLTRLYLITLPLVIALILATLCAPPAKWLRSRGAPAALSAFIVVFGGLAVIVGALALLAPSFASQISELQPTLQTGVDSVLQWAEDGPLGFDQARINELITQARESAAGSSSAIVAGVAAGARIALEVVASLLLILVLLFFFVKDGEDIVDWMIARTPRKHRDLVRGLGARSWTALGGYVRGTAAIALIDATGVAIGLLIIGVPLVLPLAVLVFLGAFLPVIGAFIAGLIAVLVALANGGFTQALFVLGLIIIVQQVEGQVLHPTIMRRTVALHPVVVLSALTAGAAVAGIVGAFLAVPIAAILAAAGNEIRVRYETPGPDGPDPLTDPEYDPEPQPAG